MTTWQFDASVASRFQKEAETHIPDYEKVITMCIEYASPFSKKSTIIDIGSALGHTVDRFISVGYVNTIGVEASLDMINSSKHSKSIIHSNAFPHIKCDIVLMNWTLHFIKHKYKYLIDVISSINTGGIFILTDKTMQSPLVKNAYYDFKRANGVPNSYIFNKEQQLADSMYVDDVPFYIDILYKVGFSSVEIINARFGFVTFLCHK